MQDSGDSASVITGSGESASSGSHSFSLGLGVSLKNLCLPTAMKYYCDYLRRVWRAKSNAARLFMPKYDMYRVYIMQ